MRNCLKIAMVLCLVLALGAVAAERKVILPKEFPKSGRPFSPGVLFGDTLYVSGMTGPDLKTGQIPDDFEAEVRQCLNNIGIVLKEAGYGFDDAVSVQVYLTDIELFQRMNAVYMTFFKEPRPTRTTVGVARLGGKARIEITLTARK